MQFPLGASSRILAVMVMVFTICGFVVDSSSAASPTTTWKFGRAQGNPGGTGFTVIMKTSVGGGTVSQIVNGKPVKVLDHVRGGYRANVITSRPMAAGSFIRTRFVRDFNDGGERSQVFSVSRLVGTCESGAYDPNRANPQGKPKTILYDLERANGIISHVSNANLLTESGVHLGGVLPETYDNNTAHGEFDVHANTMINCAQKAANDVFVDSPGAQNAPDIKVSIAASFG